ncbi:MAG: ComF family protein [Spirochaetota bacterium]|nr:ComF family protein [Spirochaetota bacterium]
MKYFSLFLKNIFSGIWYPVINSLFPNYCRVCDDILWGGRLAFCEDCLSEIPRISEQRHCKVCGSLYFVDENTLCQHCGSGFHETVYFKKNISRFSYMGPIQKLILQGKFHGRLSCWTFLGKEMLNDLLEQDWDADMLVTAVPVSRKRMAERGFNQSDIMGRIIARGLALPYKANCLKKIRNTVRQASLNHIDRINNPVGSYQVTNNKAVRGKGILLVDDVFTTGSTVNECSRVLMEAGAKVIYTVTAARRDLG